jgi:hypothetical protein
MEIPCDDFLDGSEEAVRLCIGIYKSGDDDGVVIGDDDAPEDDDTDDGDGGSDANGDLVARRGMSMGEDIRMNGFEM